MDQPCSVRQWKHRQLPGVSPQALFLAHPGPAPSRNAPAIPHSLYREVPPSPACRLHVWLPRVDTFKARPLCGPLIGPKLALGRVAAGTGGKAGAVHLSELVLSRLALPCLALTETYTDTERQTETDKNPSMLGSLRIIYLASSIRTLHLPLPQEQDLRTTLLCFS